MAKQVIIKKEENKVSIYQKTQSIKSALIEWSEGAKDLDGAYILDIILKVSSGNKGMASLVSKTVYRHKKCSEKQAELIANAAIEMSIKI